MNYLKYILIAALIPVISFGKTGVGLNTSDIKIEETIKPGGIYTLSSLQVKNTGDAETKYAMSVIHHEGQEQLMVPPEWVKFTPETFTLRGGESRFIEVELNIPFSAEAGDYRAYLESRVVRDKGIGVAAAAKLSFSVDEGTFAQALMSRMLTRLDYYKPWTYILLWVFVASVPLAIIKRKFEFKLNIKSKKRRNEKIFELIPR